MADDDIDLASLSDDDLVAQMHDDLYDGLKEEIEQSVNILLERGWIPYDVLTKALVATAPCRDCSTASSHRAFGRTPRSSSAVSPATRR